VSEEVLVATGDPAPGATTDEGGGGTAVTLPGTDELPLGAARTASGRISAAQEFDDSAPVSPFRPAQLGRLDEALRMCSRETGLPIGLYLGDLGDDPSARADELHAGLADPAEAVLIAVSPQQRVVEVLTGGAARHRLPDSTAKLAVTGMVTSLREGDLLGGLLHGLRVLAGASGGRHRR
jgi:hypothetical protein